LSQKALLICVATGGRQGETGKTGRKQFCVTPVSRLELCERPDKTACCRLTQNPTDGVSNVVHRTQIQNKSAQLSNKTKPQRPTKNAPTADFTKTQPQNTPISRITLAIAIQPNLVFAQPIIRITRSRCIYLSKLLFLQPFQVSV
ncbi:hypothetical protein, partial [Rheinheimera tangshanensis]|uniref:hypothetical protein n=1 Tax=Rheinheimera tangshanensis TaxID=400153 RepID=UPI001E3FE816